MRAVFYLDSVARRGTVHDIGLRPGNYPSIVKIVDNKAITINLIKGIREGI